MAPNPPRWLRERIESDTKFSDSGFWKYIAVLVGIVALLAAVLIWFFRNLANFP